MKYLSLIALIALMATSWIFIQTKPILAESTHHEIQDDFKKFVADYIKKNMENSKNVKFHRLWTESVSENKIKTTFTYSFTDDQTDDSTNLRIQGFAILNKDKKTAGEATENWLIDELNISEHHIVFDEGIDFNLDNSESAQE